MPRTAGSSKVETITSNMTSAKTLALNISENDSLLARFLAELPLSPLRASTPTQPRAMSIAKTKAKTPQNASKIVDRYKRSESPSPRTPRSKRRVSDVESTRSASKHHSSSHHSPTLVILSSRKRGNEDISLSPPSKRRVSQDHTPTPVPRKRNDHWSPNSSQVSSPVRPAPRVVPIPATGVYLHLKSSRSTLSREAPRPRVATSSSTYKKCPGRLSIAIPKPDDEAEKRICYNCGKKGHWFMDCMLGCGKCGKDGHRTIDCLVVKLRARGLAEKENIKEETVTVF